ncbi:MAG: hypothetical protein PHH54_02785 [Candidatus Nanoarchaeia archaeon]|nr:hypothetical protein [Candidatus Nanoarchaeia archaeon]MDD5740886.1 hypothetical protein [Candidatus Nanoarchaeia archaeon]
MKFKKIMSVIASAIMISSTIGFAAAATFPAPFDSGSAIVYGSTGNVQTDMAAAINIQTAIGQLKGVTANIPEGSWQVKTSSDYLELNESISEVTSYIDKEDLPLLADGTISNEKGTAKYEQFLYFEGTVGSMVKYQEDDDENVGLFYKVDSGQVIARYVMDFTSNLESDVAVSTLEDIDDEEIVLLGKTYTITNAVNATTANNVQLTLMGGADKVTISNGEELTVAGKTVSVLVSSSTAAQFTIDGEQTSKLADGDTYKLADGTYLGVSDITYQDFAGGLMQSTIYLGADKLVLKNGTSLEVNGETISNARVDIGATTSGGDIAITEIAVNMTAEDDLYVPVGGKLSAAADLDEPQVMISQNWDIVFDGLEDTTYEDFSLKRSTDSKIEMSFENYNGDKITFPLVYSNDSGIYAGEKQGYKLVLNESACTAVDNQDIMKNNYFILNTANASVQSSDARSYVIQYKGSDKVTDTTPKMRFDVIGVDSSKEVTLTTAGTADLKLGGATFSFKNVTVGTSDDFPICLTSAVGMYSLGTALGNNGSMSNFLRTKSNTLINITHFNESVGGTGVASNWEVALYIDDTDKDGDKYTASSSNLLFKAKYANNSDDEISSTFSGGTYASWVADTTDSTHLTYTDFYGTGYDYLIPSGSPANIELKIPESIVKPKVFVTSGAITSSTAGGLALIVDDTKVDTVKDKNLVVVGGSCINTVAAKLLGSDVPLCTAEFTAKTGVGPGQYIIKTIANPYTAADSGKIAMLVAGYEAADTSNAAAKAAEKTISTEAGTSQVYPIVGTA